MKFLIDGHNLIGQMPGISLSDEDDEAKLVLALRGFATADRRRSLIVVFDHGVYGHPHSLDGYGVACFFARSPQDADTQLIKRITAITRPSEWRVITSDREVARAATSHNIRVTSSHDFVHELSAPAKPRTAQPTDKPEARLSPAQINEWLRLFGEEPEHSAEAIAPVQQPKAEKTQVRKKRVRKR
ncbi:MAG: NYN domain-containing protein [Roseiflexaceae bacterium]|nr:NYN domain-containing protein [Roseiflexaceae bacterium]